MAVKPQRAKAQAQQRCAHTGDRVRDFPWSYNPPPKRLPGRLDGLEDSL